MIKMMNKNTVILTLALLTFLVFTPIAQAKQYTNYHTYEVIAVTENGLTIKSESGKEIVLEKDTKSYKVGDKVRYDSKRNRLKKYNVQEN